MRTAENNISNTKRELDTKTQSYEESLELLAVGAISKAELDAAQRAMEVALENYNDAAHALADINKTLSDELDSAWDALVNAQTAYDSANLSVKTTNTSVQQELTKYRDNIENARLSAKSDNQVFQLDRLERQLAQTQVRATASGTITAIYIKEGVVANGLLFVIEDTDSLKISTSIKEYNLSKVESGLLAKIESDATGDELYDGVLTLISPASKKDNTGNSIAVADVDFEAEVLVVAGSNLRIGSNARVDLIYEQREGALHVPIESVMTDIDGTSFVYALIPQNGGAPVDIDTTAFRVGEGRPLGESAPDGAEMPRREMPNTLLDPNATYRVSRIEVTTGMETDLYIEVSGSGLRPGIMIANSPMLVNEVDTVKIGLNNSGFRSPGDGGMGDPRGMGPSGGMGPAMRIGG